MFDRVTAIQMNQHKAPSRAVDSRAISRGPDFTPAFADFGRQMSGGRGAAVSDAQQRATFLEKFLPIILRFSVCIFLYI